MGQFFIIGNGFDLTHEIKSKYADFKAWLIDEGNKEHIQMIEQTFCINGEDWSDYEAALGRYDIEEMYEWITDGLEIDLDHMMRSQFIYEDAPDIMMGKFWQDIHEKFCDWVNTIKVSSAVRNFSLPAHAKYLTFNYTRTLEEVYAIPESQILHIHGCAPSDDLVVGHDCYAAPNPEYGGNQWEMEEGVREQIKGAMNSNYKDVQSIISANAAYFASLSNVDHITVIGHSYNRIDMPYFRAIKDAVGPQCRWELCWYTDADKANADAMIAALGIDPALCSFVRTGGQ